jgi:hypothetical protein
MPSKRLLPSTQDEARAFNSQYRFAVTVDASLKINAAATNDFHSRGRQFGQTDWRTGRAVDAQSAAQAHR